MFVCRCICTCMYYCVQLIDVKKKNIFCVLYLYLRVHLSYFLNVFAQVIIVDCISALYMKFKKFSIKYVYYFFLYYSPPSRFDLVVKSYKSAIANLIIHKMCRVKIVKVSLWNFFINNISSLTPPSLRKKIVSHTTVSSTGNIKDIYVPIYMDQSKVDTVFFRCF